MNVQKDLVKILGEKYSCIMVDKILSFEPQQYIYAIKNVSLTDLGFTNKTLHLASSSVFVIIESIFQVAEFFMEQSGFTPHVLAFELGSVDGFTAPGDTIGIELEVTEHVGRVLHVVGTVIREGQILCKTKLQLDAGQSIHDSHI